MNVTASPATTQEETLGTRLRNIAVGTLFALVLLVPKVLHLRRDPPSWMAFRILLAVAGAALVVLPLSLWNSWLAALAGLAMFLTSILLPPAKSHTRVDDKARELGALVVVNGGEYQPSNAPAAAVQLFAGTERIWALDARLQPLLEIPASEISSVRADEIGAQWVLRIRWTDRVVEFSYRGVFAEHLARVAESTIRSVMRSPLPVLPRSRAAGA
jgi:hypothetical protein